MTAVLCSVESVEAPTIRVLVVDADPLVRATLSLLLRYADHITVVGTAGDRAGDPAAITDSMGRARPHVALVDARLRLPATQFAGPPIILLGSVDDGRQVLTGLRAGAVGYLAKDSTPEQLVQAIEGAAKGVGVLSTRVIQGLVRRLGSPEDRDRAASARCRLGLLSKTELSVAQGVADGLTNQEIAAELYLSANTVKSYVSRVFMRLQVTNRVQVCLLVREARLR